MKTILSIMLKLGLQFLNGLLLTLFLMSVIGLPGALLYLAYKSVGMGVLLIVATVAFITYLGEDLEIVQNIQDKWKEWRNAER